MNPRPLISFLVGMTQRNPLVGFYLFIHGESALMPILLSKLFYSPRKNDTPQVLDDIAAEQCIVQSVGEYVNHDQFQ